MAILPISHFTPVTLIYLLLFSSNATSILALNITNLLSSHPDFSDFTNLLLTSSVAADLSHRSSLTILAVPNNFLRSSDLPHHLDDVLRYHILLQFLSWPDLRRVPTAGELVTTLYQTTGRAAGSSGSLNITRNPATDVVSVFSSAASSASNATVLSLIETLPYNVSIFAVNSLLIPYGFDLMASETRPPMGLNITKALIDGQNFNVVASMLAASGVVEEFEADEGGAGITLFVPTDEAFLNLPPTAKFQSLPADKKAVVLKFHVLHSYYPLGSLESIVNPVQPTLATEDMGAGSFTLNISRINGSVSINTGIVQATVTRTVFDQNPVAIFGVSRVLLPRDIFVNNRVGMSKPSIGGAPPPEQSLTPESLPGLYGPSSPLSSEAANNCIQTLNFALFCIGLYLLV